MRIIFTLLFITTLSLSSLSQTTTSVYGGMNLSTWTGSANKFAKHLVNNTIGLEWLSKYEFEKEFRFGFTIGFNIEFLISKNAYFQPGISYSQKGTGFTGFRKNLNTSVERKMKMITNYLEIPLLYKLNIPSGKETFYFFGGPTIGYLIHSKINFKLDFDIDTYFREMDLENCSPFQFNLNLGAGIDFCNKFKVEIKYEAGLSPVFDDNVNKQYNLKNSLFSICFAYHN